MTHAAGLALLPAQGCMQCCNQSNRRSPSDPFVFQVANRKGVLLQAVGSVASSPDGPIVLVKPTTNVTGSWLASVQFGVLDIPQCVLYNSAELPAVPFEFPVPWPAA
jgi:hypothetical protein